MSTFSDDQHKELEFGYIMANPPFNLKKYADPELYYAAYYDEIQEKGYSFVPSGYVEFIDRDMEIGYKSALSEMSRKFDGLKKRWDANETELVNAFKILRYGKGQNTAS